MSSTPYIIISVRSFVDIQGFERGATSKKYILRKIFFRKTFHQKLLLRTDHFRKIFFPETFLARVVPRGYPLWCFQVWLHPGNHLYSPLPSATDTRVHRHPGDLNGFWRHVPTAVDGYYILVDRLHGDGVASGVGRQVELNIRRGCGARWEPLGRIRGCKRRMSSPCANQAKLFSTIQTATQVAQNPFRYLRDVSATLNRDQFAS